MAWLKIDTGFARHRKVGRLAYADRWHHLEAMCWCAEMGTDGRIEEVDLAVIWPGMPAKKATAIAASLTDAGVWDEHSDGGWIVHDWGEYNISADDAKAQREANAKRQAELRKRRREAKRVTRDTQRDVTPGVTRDVTRESRNPRARRPDPTPSSKEEGRVADTITPESAAATPEPEPGAQSPPPDVESRTADLVDFDSLAAASPVMRAGIARGRARASA